MVLSTASVSIDNSIDNTYWFSPSPAQARVPRSHIPTPAAAPPQQRAPSQAPNRSLCANQASSVRPLGLATCLRGHPDRYCVGLAHLPRPRMYRACCTAVTTRTSVICTPRVPGRQPLGAWVRAKRAPVPPPGIGSGSVSIDNSIED